VAARAFELMGSPGAKGYDCVIARAFDASAVTINRARVVATASADVPRERVYQVSLLAPFWGLAARQSDPIVAPGARYVSTATNDLDMRLAVHSSNREPPLFGCDGVDADLVRLFSWNLVRAECVAPIGRGRKCILHDWPTPNGAWSAVAVLSAVYKGASDAKTKCPRPSSRSV
jgi:hypothetical protein